MPAPPATDLRLAATAAGSFALLAALASYAAAAADRLGPLLGALGAGAALLLALGLAVRLPLLVPWALAVLGSEYTAFLYLGGGGRLLPVYAAAFVLVAELAYWALEPRSVADDAASLALRTATVALTTAVAGALGALLASVSNEEVSGGLGIEAAGIAAAVVALGLVAGLAHRRVRQEGLERAVRERDGA